MSTNRKHEDRSVQSGANETAAAEATRHGKIGNRIKEIRLAHNLNQSDFARLMGVERSYLSRVERGQVKPSIEIIAGMLQLPRAVNLRYVFFGVGDNPFLEGLPLHVRDVAEFEGFFIRAAEEENKLPAKFSPAHISSQTYRRWLVRNIYEQVERMSPHLSNPNISMIWQPEDKAKAIDEVEAALSAAEASDRPPAIRRRVRRPKAP